MITVEHFLLSLFKESQTKGCPVAAAAKKCLHTVTGDAWAFLTAAALPLSLPPTTALLFLPYTAHTHIYTFSKEKSLTFGSIFQNI